MKSCPILSEAQIQKLKKELKKVARAKEAKRIQAILLLEQASFVPWKRQEDFRRIEEITGFKRSRIYGLRKVFLKEGIKAIKERKGKPKELLTKKQLKEVSDTLRKKSPLNLGYHSQFWTTAILADFIEETYKVRYKSKTSYYLIFKRIKFTYHKPGRVYEKRNEKQVKKWRRQTRPILKKAWQDKNTVVLAEDEMVLSTQTTFQKIWLPANHYPRIEISNTKKNRSIYGFLNIKAGKEHAFKTEKQNMFITAKILKKIREIYPKKKILLFWDGPGWHRGSVAQEFIDKDGKIATIYFPAYSPEENPQEKVWREGRDKVTHNKFIQNIDKATDEFIAYLSRAKFCYSLLGLKSNLRM